MQLECVLTYPERRKDPANLSERITEDIGEGRHGSRVVIGDLDLAFGRYDWESAWRLEDMLLFTNMSHWERTELAMPDLVSGETYLDFAIAEPRQDVVSSIAGTPSIRYDARQRRLRLDWPNVGPAARWPRIADGLLAGVTAEDELAALLFEDVIERVEYG